VQPISESSIVKTTLKTIGTIIAAVVIAGSLYWTNRHHIEQLQDTTKKLELETEKLDEQIRRLEIELTKLRK
jgi:hypothetical protein